MLLLLCGSLLVCRYILGRYLLGELACGGSLGRNRLGFVLWEAIWAYDSYRLGLLRSWLDRWLHLLINWVLALLYTCWLILSYWRDSLGLRWLLLLLLLRRNNWLRLR